MNDAKNKLTRKVGPLPVYAWALLAVAGYLAWRHFSGSSSSASSNPSTAAMDGSNPLTAGTTNGTLPGSAGGSGSTTENVYNYYSTGKAQPHPKGHTHDKGGHGHHDKPHHPRPSHGPGGKGTGGPAPKPRRRKKPQPVPGGGGARPFVPE